MIGDSMRIDKRTYINKDVTEKMINYFDEQSIDQKKERQVIYTYHTETDFRLIRTKNYVKLDLKTNDIHKENRVYIHKNYEADIIHILTQIGMYVAVKRYRIRHMYHYNNFYITIDENMKYGNVFRISFDYKTEEEKEKNLIQIKKIYDYFEITESSMETFQELYSKYRTSWADLTKDIDEEIFLKEDI